MEQGQNRQASSLGGAESQGDLYEDQKPRVTRYRIVSGDAGSLRGIIELDALSYSVTSEGTLVVMGESGKLAEYNASAWRSIVAVEAFASALKGGTGEEISRRARTAT
jgi:hypothetical protein